MNDLQRHGPSYGNAGVLTKLDIMDRGTNAVRVLQNQVVPLRLGYIGEQGCCAACPLYCRRLLCVQRCKASTAEGLLPAPWHRLLLDPGCACSAGVINRSQQDIITRRNIRDARAAEAAFFEAHPEYREVSLPSLAALLLPAGPANTATCWSSRLPLPFIRR